MLQVFQVIFVLFALFAMGQVLGRKKQELLSVNGALFWLLVWCAAIVVVVWPDLTQKIADRFGIGRGADFVLYIALASMFFAVFRLHIKIESMQRDITKVVRKEALKK